jgi:hypothetical protein
MIRTAVISTLLLSGLVAGASVQAATKDPCVSTPDASAGGGQSSVTGGLADPGPCTIATSTKGSKNGKSSNSAKGSGNGKGPSNGNGNGNGSGNGSDNGQSNNSDESKIQQGLAIAPVQLNLQGRNRALVGLGSYIVNAQAGCNDCHTWPNFAPGGNPYQGQTKLINSANYLAGGRPFKLPAETVWSRNLTPNPSESLTEEQRYAEFLRVMRSGHDPEKEGRLLQVMPWPVYQDMTDRDLQAIFEYLQTIPHADPYCLGADPTKPICNP